jgi:aldehyde:ferredoxin oxidoreductase
MGSAIFWDLVKDKTIYGFDPRNVVTIMTSPLSGPLPLALLLGQRFRGLESSPLRLNGSPEQFRRRFAPMLKYAGWDGIVIEGKADKPVWVDIRNEDVKFKDARHLWGLDTWKAQEEIWREVSGRGYGSWMELGSDERTTQRPAVLTIGPAGENLSRTACLIHDAGNASGQGGFGGIWGSKNLKAVSVIGTGSIMVADPKGLIEARLWAQKKYGLDLEIPDPSWFSRFGPRRPQNRYWDKQEQARLQACIGCHQGCKERSETGLGNESTCVETSFMHTMIKGSMGETDLSRIHRCRSTSKYGINAFEASVGLNYIRALNKMGILGRSGKIKCDLDFGKLERSNCDHFSR